MKMLTSVKEKGRANAIIIPQESRELLVLCVEDNSLKAELEKFCNTHVVEEQLKHLKQMSGVYLKTPIISQKNSEIFVEFATEVYVNAEVKNPVRNVLVKLLSSAPSHLRLHIVTCLSKRFAAIVSKTHDALCSDGLHTKESLDAVVSNMVMSMSFDLAAQALMSHNKIILVFLVKCLETYHSVALVERAASVREDLHRCTHNAARAILVFLQNCNDKKNKFSENSIVGALDKRTKDEFISTLQTIGKQLYHVLIQLLCLEELPLELRCTCALSLVAYCTLAVPKTWCQLLLVVEGQEVSDCLHELSCASDLTRLSLCVGLLGSLPVTELMHPAAHVSNSCIVLATILQSLLLLANRKPSQPTLELGTARAISQALRILTTVLNISDTETKFLSLKVSEKTMDRQDEQTKEEESVGDLMHVSAIENTLKTVIVDVTPNLLPVLWMEVEHSMDSVRHAARGSIQNFVNIADLLESKGDGRAAQVLRTQLSALAPFRRARYLALAAVAGAVGVGRGTFAVALADAAGATPEALLAAVAEGGSGVVPHAAAAFEALQAAEGTAPSTHWLQRWVQPLLQALARGASACPLSQMEALVAKAVARCPEGVVALALDTFLPPCPSPSHEDLITKPSPLPPATHLRTLLLCLGAARRQGTFDNKEDIVDMWKGVIAYDVLHHCALHACDEVRLGVLALMAETRRSTEALSILELEMARVALTQLAPTPAPATRQRAAALLRRILRRLRASKYSNGTSFLHWLPTCALHEGLCPTANHARRAFSLQVLQLIIEELEEETPTVLWEPSNAQILLEVLWDPYEDNKSTALYLLRKFPVESLNIQSKDFTIGLMEMCVSLAQSVRPADSATAAYLLRFVASFPEVEAVMAFLQHVDQQFSISSATESIDFCSKLTVQYQAICVFTKLLKRQLIVAKTNIMRAAVKGPMYGTILCLRLLLEDCDLQSVADCEEWQSVITQLIDCSFDAVTAVEDVVNSASPEGHLPMDAQPFAELQRDHTESVDTVCGNVTAQQVLLCAWRTVKEASLLLGGLAMKAPLVDGAAPEGNLKGLLKGKQLLAMGQRFIRLLAEVKHRGAFEQIYVGFTQLCTRLWSLGKKAVACDNGRPVALHGLPESWLNELLHMVSSAGSSNVGTALCVTRRSAGVPFIVQALLGTEPSSATGETSVYPQCMEMLLCLAKQNENSEAKTHALNILRAVFRNAVLCERTAPYISHAVQVAVNGCHAEIWSVRNAATLLMGTLITRLFGVPSAKDRQRLRRMTGRLFFHQHPSLYDFLLAELTPQHKSLQQVFEPFPALLLLSRLYPSSFEGMDSNLQLSRFVPLVRACARCSAERTRALAAQALAPLASPDDWHSLLTLVLDSAASRKVSWNTCHGYLLQAVALLQTFSIYLKQDETLQESLLSWLKSSHWLLVLPKNKYVNFPVAEAYLQVVQELTNSILEKTVQQQNMQMNVASDKFLERNDTSKREDDKMAGYSLWENIRLLIMEILGELEKNLTNVLPQPGLSLYKIRASQLLLTLTKILHLSELPSVLSNLVLYKSAEVALTSLCFILHIFKHTPLKLPFEEEQETKIEVECDDELERVLKENSPLAHAVAKLLLQFPEKQLHPDLQLCCFQLMTYLSLVLPWLVNLLPVSTCNVSKEERRGDGSNVLHWLLEAFKMDVEKIGPAVVAVLDSFFPSPEEMHCQVDLSLVSSDFQLLCATLESASAPECPVELRYSLACLLSSPRLSQFLLHPSEQQEGSWLSLCFLWTAALLLLDDDDEEVRQQAASLSLCLPKSCNLPVAEAIAREMLVSAFVERVIEKAPLHAVATLMVWILKRDISGLETETIEDQLFEQSEANVYGEPALLAKVSSDALRIALLERPDLVSCPLPVDVCTWLVRHCWSESSSIQKCLSLQEVGCIEEQRLSSSSTATGNKQPALLPSPHVRFGTLRLHLLQTALTPF